MSPKTFKTFMSRRCINLSSCSSDFRPSKRRQLTIMKLFVIACMLPLVFGQGCDEKCNDCMTIQCGVNEISCDSGVDDNNCWMGNWCLALTEGCPTANCEPPACGPDEMMCADECMKFCRPMDGKHLLHTNYMLYEIIHYFIGVITFVYFAFL